VELHNFGEVRQEVSQTVIAGVWMILVDNAYLLQFDVQGRGTLLKAVVILLAAVEIDCDVA
jgi:hypothetical protein